MTKQDTVVRFDNVSFERNLCVVLPEEVGKVIVSVPSVEKTIKRVEPVFLGIARFRRRANSPLPNGRGCVACIFEQLGQRELAGQ